MSKNQSTEQVEPLASREEQRQDQDEVGPIFCTKLDQRATSTQGRRFESFRQSSGATISILRHRRWLGTWLLARLGMLDRQRRLRTSQESGTGNGLTFAQLQPKGANPNVAASRGHYSEVSTTVPLRPGLVPSEVTSNAGNNAAGTPTPFVGSTNFISGTLSAELELQSIQDLIDSASSPYLVSSRPFPRSASERASIIVLSSGKATNWLRDVKLYGLGSDEANGVDFITRLDTGADMNIMAENVAARFGIDQMDRSDQPNIEVLAEKGVKALGRIDIEFRLPLSSQWYRGSFFVIRDSVVRGRFDTLMGRDAVGKMNWLLLGPPLGGQTLQKETAMPTLRDHAGFSR